MMLSGVKLSVYSIKQKQKVTNVMLEILFIIILNFYLIIFINVYPPLMAGQNDTPRRIHLTHDRGPRILSCTICHTNAPVYNNVDRIKCYLCP